MQGVTKMQSSYKIIKNQNIANEKKAISIINTRAIETYKNENKELVDKDSGEEINLTSDEIQREVLMRLEEERLNIISIARKQAEAIISEAKKIGFKEGFDKGYNEAMDKARQEAARIKDQALSLIKQAESDLADYYKENQENIIRLSAQMAEAIIHHKIDTSEEDILLLIKPILEKYEGNGNIVITCHPDRLSIMKERAEELQALSANTRFVILSDDNLEERGCIIESQHQFIDLQIGKQLESILKEINKME